jgi:hypothetical protein
VQLGQCTGTERERDRERERERERERDFLNKILNFIQAFWLIYIRNDFDINETRYYSTSDTASRTSSYFSAQVIGV